MDTENVVSLKSKNEIPRLHDLALAQSIMKALYDEDIIEPVPSDYVPEVPALMAGEKSFTSLTSSEIVVYRSAMYLSEIIVETNRENSAKNAEQYATLLRDKTMTPDKVAEQMHKSIDSSEELNIMVRLISNNRLLHEIWVHSVKSRTNHWRGIDMRKGYKVIKSQPILSDFTEQPDHG